LRDDKLRCYSSSVGYSRYLRPRRVGHRCLRPRRVRRLRLHRRMRPKGNLSNNLLNVNEWNLSLYICFLDFLFAVLFHIIRYGKRYGSLAGFVIERLFKSIYTSPTIVSNLWMLGSVCAAPLLYCLGMHLDNKLVERKVQSYPFDLTKLKDKSSEYYSGDG